LLVNTRVVITNIQVELGMNGAMQQIVNAMKDLGKLEDNPRKIFDCAIVDNAHLVPEL